ncbi:Ubiquitin thioesterase otulin isoform X2 [Oopsacas minuta]|uniref:Ubiquitin thioesterase otulin isoform X2 n=1 Tax=Oopsacas minuta TaxID=111878 RepID=A0AAV7KH08_9METZ|nr:Ubiquitin thioesterase otulin isoform X2 [Oopsacas minuta]
MNDQDSDKSSYMPIVSDEVRDRYQDGPRYLKTPSLNSVSVGSRNTTDLITKNSLPSLTHSSIKEDSPSNIQHISDIVVASPQKSDVIPGLTLDGPPNRIDLTVNSITGMIHEKTEDMANSSTEERSDHSLAPDDTHVDSKMTEPHVDNGVTHFENSDSSVSFPGQSSVQTGSNIGEIDVTEGLSIDQRHIYIGENDILFSDFIPSPIHTVKTEYQTANNSETDYQTIGTSSQNLDDLSVTTNGNEDVDTMSPLSLLESLTFPYDPKNTADYFQLLQNAIHTDKQQQLLSSQLYPDSLLISSIGNTPEQTPLQNSDSFVTLPEYNTDLDIYVTNIGCNPELPQAFSPSTSLPAQMDHDTIIIEYNRLSIHSQNNTISTTQVPFDEVQIQPQGNDAGDFVTDRYQDNTTPIPIKRTHLHQRSVDSPITFSDYIAREWIGTSDNAKRVRNGYHKLEMMGYTHLMSIRGDNYCALRCTLFQTFCVRDFNVCSFLANMKPPIEARQIVAPMMEKYPFLSKWSFANKPSFQELGETKDVLEKCIYNLAFEVDHVRGWEPVNQLAKYWEIYSQGGDIPESMFFLFIREDSMNLEDFLVNHLNHVGDSGGLEMDEMFLLGFTLDLQIKEAHISSFDFSILTGIRSLTKHIISATNLSSEKM